MPLRTTTLFMLLRATPQWRALDPFERESALDDALACVYGGFPAVRLKFYDTGAFSPRCSLLALWEADDLKEYHDAVQALGQTRFFGAPLFEAVEVIVGAEDGWRPSPQASPLLERAVLMD